MTDLKPNPAARQEWFASTHWSVVLAAKEGDAEIANEALEQLCRTYWPPLYAFIRREGYDDAEAKDLTQEFFFRLITREFLQHLCHQRGKFRSFLLTFVKNFLSEQRGKNKAQKRGGGKVIVSWDQVGPEGAYLNEPVDHMSPDQVFERRWAQTILQTALNRLRTEYIHADKEALFDLLKDFQPRERDALSYAEIGARLGMSEAAIKSFVQRMRARHRQILREEIGKTVMRADEIEEEIRHLRDVLSGTR